MTIPVYEAEREAGLEEVIKCNASIAYDATARIFKPEHQPDISLASLKHPELAQANKNNQWDLNWMSSILVSVGWNANDDIFTPEDTWAARHSPDHKYINYMHNEKDIIGHMVASTVIDYDGNLIPDDTSEIPKQFEIAVNGVLYAKWTDELLQERMNKIIAGMANDEWFVSMECLFSQFDYGLITPDGEHKIIARNEQSAFLTKHLRIYGGTGQFEGHTIGRLLRNFIFSGKGIVDNPANPRSVIINSTKVFKASSDTIDNKPYIIKEKAKMPDANMLEDVKSQLAESKARADKLAAKLDDKVAEAQKAERAKFEGTIATLKVDVSDLETEKDALATKLTEKDEASVVTAKELKTSAAKIAELEASLEKVEAEKVSANRASELVAVGLTTDEASEVVETWAGSSDEQFADVVKLHTAAKDNPFAKDGDKDDKDKKDKKDKKADAEIDNNDDKAAADVDDADVDDDADLNAGSVDEGAELRASASEWFASNLRCGTTETE